MSLQHKQKKPLLFTEIIGMILLLCGVLVFSGSVLLENYHYSAQSHALLIEKVQPERLQFMRNAIGKTFDSKFAFLAYIEQTINADGGMNAYQLGEAKFWILKFSISGILADHILLLLFLSIGLAIIGGLLFILPKMRFSPGIKNDHIYFSRLMNRGWLGIGLGTYLIAFYVLLYWYPELVVGAIKLVDPVSNFLKNVPADRWFMYGFLYTITVTVMGIRMLIKYRHSNYHLLRTVSIIFFQMGFAFLLPTIMERLNKPGMDLKNAWPLNYSFFTDWNMDWLLNSGKFGVFLFFWGIVLSIVVVPLMTYFFGKRWYCSWVCGCGGLAETLGDPFRQLSDKSVKAWKVERWMIHAVLVFAVIMTVMQLANYISNGAIFASYTWRVNQAYSFLIGSAFAGVIGTGFYPFMGSRVWCRFGCPLAAIMGIIQKFKSRFVITTNGGQCISCGNCSTYCEMGIDVRWYAQRGQNIIRASCVGCGVCAAVCPRGVLRLENTTPGQRYNAVLDDELIVAEK